MTALRFRQGKSDSAARKFAEQVSDSQHPAADKDQPRASIDAVARIFRPSRSVMTSARLSRRPWLLVFERKDPPVIDHLMGYTGGSDTLTQVELRFPSRDAAIAYAERQKLNYTVVEDRRR
ncbi:NADH dehydrogenase ubiquinone Fe-S protein 4 [Sinorhizobium fredii]|uniref:NADH dehydrogenase ubiquinone Fe-S protein n=1 Tax=Rhizobium fredii TaxID=380 RepID=A0A2L0HAY8_RHIFR|nr:NADH dehydrogenase ubiquinone Fe-S protein 4 [Sinorhizobium fredii]AUX78577.1 NADH dehydrogenase ubiquinone Fe-S protein [Sinorhizobium fredii]